MPLSARTQFQLDSTGDTDQVVKMSGSWASADDTDRAWLVQVSEHIDVAGHHLRPLPDKVWVLHPLFERIDGQSMYDLFPNSTSDGRTMLSDDDGRTVAEGRAVTWLEYADRRNIPLVTGRGWPSGRDALGHVWGDESVSNPSEGEIEDERTRSALFDTLISHSERGPATICTAWWYDFWVDDDAFGHRPNILRGPLGAWRELYDRDDRVLGPQNVWPDDHTWVLDTHVDSWATAVSGPAVLTGALLRNPELEVVRLTPR